MKLDHDNLHDDELRHAARRLGADAAERLDVERTAQAVLDRLRAGEHPRKSPIHWMQPAWMRAAAAVVLIVGAGLVVRHRLNQPTELGARDSASTSGEFAGLSSGQLRDVLAGFDDSLEAPVVHAGEAGVEDLSASQLQSLLQSMGGED